MWLEYDKVWLGIPLDESRRKPGKYCILHSWVDCVPIPTQELNSPMEFLDPHTAVHRYGPSFYTYIWLFDLTHFAV